MTLVIAMGSIVSVSSPVDGKWWNVEAGGARGNQTISLDLQEKDGRLLGTIKEFTAQPRDILNGKVNSNAFSFETAGFVNGRDVTVLWSGSVTGNEMTVIRKIQFDDGRIIDAPNNPLKLYRETPFVSQDRGYGHSKPEIVVGPWFRSSDEGRDPAGTFESS